MRFQMGASGNTETVLTEMQEKYAPILSSDCSSLLSSGRRDDLIDSEGKVHRLKALVWQVFHVSIEIEREPSCLREWGMS